MPADHFDLVTRWRLDAPAEKVWQVLSDAERWPEWWPCVEAVEKIDPGGTNGENSLWAYTWKTMLPYRLRLEFRMTRIAAPVLLEADVRGDVAGRGLCRIYRQEHRTVVQYEWNVRLCRSWMKRLAPLARPVFLWNHRMVMRQGEASLAARLASDGGTLSPDPPARHGGAVTAGACSAPPRHSIQESRPPR
ncbi:SRPBCC family protein [Methylococcus mesophilus]|uniref:SRPBCC family protein n=1 Tax=Methylococcus mesophilus TaxID=2993564 RepID=UPI00224B5AF4|nr:SRPBCC family protein [Methylococcus mesophilus]UZR30841.1 SRPBCC family protein [Methylococcus mesophilus]